MANQPPDDGSTRDESTKEDDFEGLLNGPILAKLFAARTTDSAAKADVPVSPQVDKYDDVAKNAEATRLKQANRLRSVFFYVGCSLAFLCVAGSLFGYVWLVVSREVTEAMVIAFTSGLCIQVIGILVIMARYLYPGEKKK